MAKTSKPKPPKDQTGPILVEEPPEQVPDTAPAEISGDDPPEEPDDPPIEGKTDVVETATREELDRQKSRRGVARESALGFFSRITKYQPTEWEKLKLYIYRLAPVTDRTAGGNPVKFLTIYREPIDEEMVLKEWGSGKYRLLLTRINEKGEGTALDRIEFEIENLNFPPKVPPGEWVDDPRNKRWAWARPESLKTADGSTQVHVAAPAAPSLKETISAVKELKQMSKEDAPPPPPAAPDPVAQLKGTVEAITGIVNLTKPPAAPENTFEKFLVTELSAERAANRELMGRLLDKKNEAPPADPLRDIAIKLLEKRLEKMDDKPEESAEAIRSRMNGTQELIAEISKHVSPVLEKAIGLFTVMAASKGAQPTGQQGIARQQPQQQQQPAGEQPQPEPEAPAAAEQNRPTMEQAQQQVLNYILGNATPTLQTYLETSDGSNFAAWFCDATFTLPNVPPPFNRLNGIDAHSFARNFGRDAILSAYKNTPGLYKQIAPTPEAEEKFIRFLDEFLAYDPNDQQED